VKFTAKQPRSLAAQCGPTHGLRAPRVEQLVHYRRAMESNLCRHEWLARRFQTGLDAALRHPRPVPPLRLQKPTFHS